MPSLKYICYLFFSLNVCIASAQTPGLNPALYKAIGIPVDAPHYFKPVRTITIAIADDGFDMDDTILNKQWAINKNEIPDNNIDDDNNGLVDDYKGWDFADNDNDVQPGLASKDLLYHGTAITKILYDVLDQLTGDGIVNFKFLPIKVKSDNGLNNYITEGYKGIAYATEQKADIIICAWSGGKYGKDEQKIIQDAINAGSIIICAAGNYEALHALYPGSYSQLIDVAAIDNEYKKMRYSNYGQFIDIAAPGDSIRYTINDPTGIVVKELSGTSASVPVVAAIAAALLASDNSLDLQKIDMLLKNSAMPLEQFNPSQYSGDLGAGVVQVDKLIQLWKKLKPITGYYDQPKAYIDFAQLAKPVMVTSPCKYKDYKLLLLNDTQNKKPALGDVRMHYFQNGTAYEKIFTADSLAYPKYITTDSFMLSSVKKSKIKPGNYYWYYEAETIDSSTLYCKGTKTIQADSGVIEDGSAGAGYTGRCDCKWQIIVPEGKHVSVSFKKFDTEAKADEVYLFDGTGTNKPILGIFSGDTLPPVVTSLGNKVLVWFLTNEFVSGKGWKLEFKAVD